MATYLLVLFTHSLRNRVGLAPFFFLLGALTVIMSWVTDAGVRVEALGITFMVGSTVFYTALLLGVFVVYIFDGPKSTRVAILAVVGISILTPAVAASLHLMAGMLGQGALPSVPVPSLRINAASVAATFADLLFLAIAWEFLGGPGRIRSPGFRALLVLLGVMSLDVVLFSTFAFLGTPDYLAIMQGTMISRLLIALFAGPFLLFYLRWQEVQTATPMVHRPVLAILHSLRDIRVELDQARQEIERRKKVEREKEQLIDELRETLAHVKKLEGLLPICSSCKKIRIGEENMERSDAWIPLEEYVRQQTDVRFSHGLCIDCLEHLYPELSDPGGAHPGKPPSGDSTGATASS